MQSGMEKHRCVRAHDTLLKRLQRLQEAVLEAKNSAQPCLPPPHALYGSIS
jgi:hypothetical protein